MNNQVIIELSMMAGLLVLISIIFFLMRRSKASPMAKFNAFLTGLLGSFFIMAGTVKFFKPFADMYDAQVTLSGMPFTPLTKLAGQLGEISAGAILVLVLIIGRQLRSEWKSKLLYGASFLLLVIMSVAITVHLNPNVPAEVLPLQSKPPYFTLVIMALVILNAYLYKQVNTHNRNQ